MNFFDGHSLDWGEHAQPHSLAWCLVLHLVSNLLWSALYSPQQNRHRRLILHSNSFLSPIAALKLEYDSSRQHLAAHCSQSHVAVAL
jgi:hypothetical protein